MTTNLMGMQQVFKTTNIDSGTRHVLNDVAGKPIYTWDSRGHQIKNTYDALQRPLEIILTKDSSDYVVEKTVYGTDATKNNIGQVAEQYDQSGITEFLSYDFKGNPLQVLKKFADEYQDKLDWTQPVTCSLQLETQYTYDALNRPLTQTQPDGSVQTNTYNEAGLLETVKKDTQTYVSNINYNEKGQRTAIYYGNGSKTRYEYDTNTFRLTRLLTTRNAGVDILQDLNYTYDPVGNIVEVLDGAQETTYYDNAPVHPKKQYTYDALYRLKSGNGRELAGLAMASAGGYFADSASVQNTQAVHQFMQQYTYDQLGNIQEIKHTVDSDPSKNWIRGYIYDESTNRLLKHDSAQTLDDYTYDDHGNITSMPHLSEMQWDHEDMLIKTTKGTESTYYRYDAAGERARKVTIKQNGDKIERLYFGSYEIYREIENGNDETNPKKERQTVHISDDSTRISMVEKLTTENGSAVSSPVEVVRYQLNDHLGSASVELNENADIISYEEYHPFGTTSYQKHNSGISQKRYRYVGKEKDNETGLYYYGARYYASWIARFVSVDPLQHNYPHYTPYQYAGNKPITYIDLDGLEEFSVTIKTTDNNRITTVRLLQNTDNKIESIKKAKVTYITNDSTYVMHGFKRKKEEAIADTIYQSYMNPKYYEENGKQVKEYLTGKRFEEKIETQQPKPDPVKLDTEIPLNITFQGSSSEFLNEEDSLEAIEKLTKTLQNNQNIEAIVTVGTNLPEDDPNASVYVRSRMMKISSEIMKSAGGFTSGAKLDFRFVPEYGKAQRTTVKYKIKDKNK